MSEQDDSIEQLSFSLGGLSVSLSRDRRRTTLSISAVGPPGSQASGEPRPDEGAAEARGGDARVEREVPLDRPPEREAEEEPEHEDPEPQLPADVVALCGRLHPAGGLSPLERVARAYRLGAGDQPAYRAAQEGGVGYQAPADAIAGLYNTVYVVLQDKHGEGPYYTERKSTFKAGCLGPTGLDRRTVCRAFATRAEATAYCKGVGLPGLPLLR